MARQQHIDALEEKRLQIADDIVRLKAQAKLSQKEIVNEAKNSAKLASHDVKGAVNDLKENAKSVFSQARSDTSSTAKAKARAAVQAADPRRVVREQPMLGLAAGVGLGALFTMLVLPKIRKRKYGTYPSDYRIENRYAVQDDLP